MDCWTFFEIALGFARMLDQPQAEWTPATLLHYVELDRYRGGHCTGEFCPACITLKIGSRTTIDADW